MAAIVVSLKGDYPLVEDALRPFKLWNAKTKEHLPRRSFSIRINAHKAALWEVSIAPVATTIEVYDCTNGRLLGQFTQRPDGTLKIYLRRGELNAQA